MGFFKRNRPEYPIYIFCYHKVGTVLFSKVFRDICKRFGWQFAVLHGYQESIDTDLDVAIMSHSLVNFDNLPEKYLGVHLIRDPRDIVVSGYLYHCRTDEPWCINTDFAESECLMFPQVPYSQQHKTEQWKREYLRSLNGRSYQQRISALDQEAGLNFEMEHYAGWTIKDMQSWSTNEQMLEMKFETVMSNFDKSFQQIFDHLRLTEANHKTAKRLAEKHDLSRKSDSQLEKMKHVSARSSSKWEEYFSDNNKQLFKDKFGSVLSQLEYETGLNW